MEFSEVHELEHNGIPSFFEGSQTLVALLVGCAPIDLWPKVRFLMNVLTFLVQVDRMDNVFLMFPMSFVTESTLRYHMQSLCCW